MNETPVSGDRRTRRASLHHAFRAVKARQADQRTRMGRVAERLTQIASSTWFFWLHVVWFAVWIGWNAGVAIGAFDPFPFGLLTMIVSLEAIFLATFVLMTQQREAGIAELREELTLQVNLRIEEEVTKDAAACRWPLHPSWPHDGAGHGIGADARAARCYGDRAGSDVTAE